MGEVATESILAAGYGLFLAFAALGVDALARHSQRRSERYRTGGFTYLEGVDAWECPEGERLHRLETDHRLRVARYRARAHVCNSCRLKEACTDSDQGREVARALDPWPHSEAGRFHRGIALVMVAMAMLVVAAGMALNHSGGDLAVLGATLGVTGLVGLYLLADLRGAPARFPWPDEYSNSPSAAPSPPAG